MEVKFEFHRNKLNFVEVNSTSMKESRKYFVEGKLLQRICFTSDEIFMEVN